jgi:hypothetical protein
MIGIIIICVVCFIPALLVYSITMHNRPDRSYVRVDAFMNGLFAFGICAVLIGAFAGIPIIKATGGLWDNYSTGIREGYVTKVSVKGVIWKTHEAQIQVGTGELAALQQPFAFSISDPLMAEYVESYLGDRVRIKYKQWYFQPYSEGESGYDCISIVPINDTEAPRSSSMEH